MSTVSTSGFATVNTDRDAQGRFILGNRGGPGNPFAGRVAEYRRLLYASVSSEDIKAIFAKLVEIAKEGHFGAMKLILSYVMGKPGAGPDPAQLDDLLAPLAGESDTRCPSPEATSGRNEAAPSTLTTPTAALPTALADLAADLEDLLRNRDKKTVEQLLGKATLDKPAPSTNGLFSSPVSELRVVPEESATISGKSARQHAQHPQKRKR